jgi:hypothetical protein
MVNGLQMDCRRLTLVVNKRIRLARTSKGIPRCFRLYGIPKMQKEQQFVFDTVTEKPLTGIAPPKEARVELPGTPCA